MYCLNSRQIEIIRWLIENNGILSINEIAQRFDVSSRSIRYDMELIESWLAENKISLIKVSKKGVGIQKFEDKEALISQLMFLSLENRVLSDNERIRYIILELIYMDKPATIETLSQTMFFSKNTILKSLKGMKVLLETYHLGINKDPKGRMFIEGNEFRIRKLLLDILIKITNSEDLLKYLRNIKAHPENEMMIGTNNKYIDNKNLVLASKVLESIESKHNYYLTDVDFIKLVIYLDLMLKRVKENHYILSSNGETLDKTKESEMAKDILYELSKERAGVFSEEETFELAKYIIESKSFNTLKELEKLSVDEIANEETIMCAKKLIQYIEEKINIKIQDDNQLFNGLVMHLKSAKARVNNNNQITSKYVDEIKEKYPFVFQVVKESLEKMKDEFVNEVNDDEIAYISLHIRAAYERISEKTSRLKALVICQEGISFLSIIVSKLKREIHNLEVIGTCSIYDYEKYKKEIDFVITTNSITVKENEVITVSPFISDNDIYLINHLINQINKFRTMYKYNSISNGGEEIMLRDILFEESIKLQVKVENWEEAISEAGKILVNKKQITEKYVENMINAIKDLGPYIVIMPGIAFAHARPDESVIETCMSMITLKTPVNFGSKEKDPVSIVFAFAAENGDTHINALQDLAKFLSVEKNVKLLNESTDVNKIYKSILNE